MTDAEGYEGVTHAGIALRALDTGRVLFAQRSYDETDAPEVSESWEFPGGGLDPDEEPYAGAVREFSEEMGVDLPADAEVESGWRSSSEVYQGFVVTTTAEFAADDEFLGTDEVQAATWGDQAWVDQAIERGILRPEMIETDWDLIFGVSGNQEDDMPDETPEVLTAAAVEGEYDSTTFDAYAPIPVHGVVAPEDVQSGDMRGFSKGAMTRRPLRLPFSDQRVSVGGHNGSVVVGSVDRLMRKDGMVHWEGALRPSPDTDDLVDRMAFFGGRYGVSVDGDQGSVDPERTAVDEQGSIAGPVWFDAIRASGLTAVAIPAFHEAYVAFGPHPEMPNEEALVASAYEEGNLIGGRVEFRRGPGWVTNPKETNRIHDYWTKPGQEGYAKIGWGTPGDFTRAKELIGAKIAEHSPDKMRFLNQIIAQWHFDALGYWPGDLGKPGNAPDTAENRRRAAVHAASEDLDRQVLDEAVSAKEGLEPVEDASVEWEAVLVSSAAGEIKRPPVDYFHQHPSMVEDVWALESGALTVEEPDAFGFRRVWGFAAEWGVCHVGIDGRCVEPPQTGNDDYPEFHLGRTKVDGGGFVTTGLLTYGVGHRDAKKILAESATQQHFDNIKNAWAAVRVGENERGVWFSGVVLPKVDTEDLTLIEASGQVSGEWKYGAMRTALTVNVPGYPVEQPTAEYDEFGNVVALAASAFGGVPNAPCNQTEDDPVGDLALAVLDRITAKQRMDALRQADATERMAALYASWKV